MLSGTLFTAETRGTVPMAIGKRWAELTARAEQDFLAGNGYFDPFAEINYHDDILEEKMRTLFAENLELNQAATEYYLLKTRYDTERVERRAD